MNHSQMGLGTGKEEETKMAIEKESDDLGHFWVTGTGPKVFSFPMPLLGGPASMNGWIFTHTEQRAIAYPR